VALAGLGEAELRSLCRSVLPHWRILVQFVNMRPGQCHIMHIGLNFSTCYEFKFCNTTLKINFGVKAGVDVELKFNFAAIVSPSTEPGLQPRDTVVGR